MCDHSQCPCEIERIEKEKQERRRQAQEQAQREYYKPFDDVFLISGAVLVVSASVFGYFGDQYSLHAACVALIIVLCMAFIDECCFCRNRILG